MASTSRQDGWAVANSTTVLKPADAYVVKCCHEAGVVKIFVCILTPEFRCPLNIPEGVGTGALPLRTGTADVWFGSTGMTSSAYSGNEDGGSDMQILQPFSGALEEIHLQRLSLERVEAALFPGGPGAGPTNYYMWDYSQPKARSHWANRTAAVINQVGAVTSQWVSTLPTCVLFALCFLRLLPCCV